MTKNAQSTGTAPTPREELVLTKAHAAATLGGPARRLHHAILRGYARTGLPPARADFHPLTDGAVELAVAELVDADLIVFDQDGELAGCYPFSTTPTAHQITLADGTKVYAMCAIDALGISAMLEQQVTITTTEPDTGHTITVHVDGDQARWQPSSAVVYAADNGDCCASSADRTCGYINFFTSEPTARAWATRHPELSGALLTQPEALTYAITEFGTLLRDPEATQQ